MGLGLALLVACTGPPREPPIDPLQEVLAEQADALDAGMLALADTKLEDATLKALLDHPAVPPLTQVRLASNQLGAGACEALATHPKARGLQRAVLGQNPLGDAGLRALAAGPNVTSLQELDVSGVGATGAGAAALAGAATGLQRLNASYQPIGDEGAVALAGLPAGAAILVERAGISGAGARALLASQAAVVELSENPIGPGGLEGVVVGSRVEAISLRDAGLTAPDVGALARAEAPVLAALDLSGNPIGDAGADALVGAPWLGRLKALEVRRAGLGQAAVERLRAAWGERRGLTVTTD